MQHRRKSQVKGQAISRPIPAVHESTEHENQHGTLKSSSFSRFLSNFPLIRTTFLASFSRYRKVPGWSPNIVTVILILIMIRISGAFLSPIEDCDETFNYWEPLHYLVFGYGYQTWEYSPQFALRSYAFLIPNYLIANVSLWTMKSSGRIVLGVWEYKKLMFYTIRVVQAVVCAISESYLYDACVWRFGKPSARTLLLFLMTSSGMYRASVEFLPSSFAMIFVTFATAAWIVGDFQLSVFGIAVSAIIGWPFSALLGIGMLIHIPIRKGIRTFLRWSFLHGTMLCVFSACVDFWFYGKPTLAVLNLIMYNVFPKENAGPDLFGVEDWKYYAFNLVLNVHAASLLLVLFPFLWIIDFVKDVWPTRKSASERAFFLTPLFVWLLVMFNQPHKEERFMAPIYPLICLTAAVSLDDFLNFLLLNSSFSAKEASNADDSKRQRGFKLRLSVKNVFVCLILLVSLTIGVSRMAAQIIGFGAPMRIYARLSGEELMHGAGPSRMAFLPQSVPINVCIGKEWYRFPSNFFLPSHRFQSRFIRSGFSGLLPKPFASDTEGNSKATAVEPPGMNMYNQEDPNQYWNATHVCHYYVDYVTNDPADDPINPIPIEFRAVVAEEDFLWSEKSPQFYRSFYIPFVTEPKWIYSKYRLYRNLKLLPKD